MKLTIRDVRLAFPHLFEKAAFADGNPSYNAVFIIDPKSANVKALDDAMRSVAAEKWGEKAKAIFAKLQSDDKVAFRRSEKTNKNGDPLDGFEGMFYLSASSKDVQPAIRDRDGKTALVAADGRPYAGCYVNAIIELWAQDHAKWGRRINASLKGVQFVRDGDAFTGGAPATDDDFEDLSVSEDDVAFA